MCANQYRRNFADKCDICKRLFNSALIWYNNLYQVKRGGVRHAEGIEPETQGFCRMGKRGFEIHKYNNGLGKPIKEGEIDGNR
jgi:hypothetical protein